MLFNYMLQLTGNTCQHLTRLAARYSQHRRLHSVTLVSRTIGKYYAAEGKIRENVENLICGAAGKVHSKSSANISDRHMLR